MMNAYAFRDNYKVNNHLVYNAGLYLRLSREDENSGPSESITNQKEFLMSFVLDQGWNLVNIYIDDGYSGTNYNRPDFKRMLADIENKKINLVITKDLSRLGRDYIDTGYYLERYFPEKNVRYIAVNDGIDTFTSSSNNDMSPFKSVMNDMYAKDISKKVRTAIDTKRRNGQFIGAFAPYGYLKDPADKNKLVVNPETAATVRRIFDMYANGNSLRYIAYTLNAGKILSPAAYKSQNSNYRGGKTKYFCWVPEMVKLILTNPTYSGNITQNRCTKINYKIKKFRSMPKESWTVVNGTHEPIVDMETFELIQQMIEKKASTQHIKGVNPHLLSGLLFCGDCGSRMTFLQGSNKNSYGVCSKYKRFKDCTRHSIPELRLQNMVMEDLRRIADASLNPDKFADEIGKEPMDHLNTQLEKEFHDCEMKLQEIKNIIKSLYEDKLKGVLTEADFMELSQGYHKERDSITVKISRLNKEKQERNKSQASHSRLMEMVQDFIAMNDISKAALIKLIQKIEIFENGEVKIHYRFQRPEYGDTPQQEASL